MKLHRGMCLNVAGSGRKDMGATETSLPNKCALRFRSWPKLCGVQKQHEYSWHASHIGQQPRGCKPFSRNKSSEAANAENRGSSPDFMLGNGANQFWPSPFQVHLHLIPTLEKASTELKLINLDTNKPFIAGSVCTGGKGPALPKRTVLSWGASLPK